MSGAPWALALDPTGHRSHPLHAQGRDWPETNCYLDLWIEMLHALGLPVEPCLAFLLAADFEGDQWTFHKPPQRDLERLYGIEVEELTLWRALLDHLEAQLARGRVPLVEADSFYLPDTAGTDYRALHTKTTIAVAELDRTRRRLVYFHNRGLYDLEGEDFAGLFRAAGDGRPEVLPPYCEIVKLDGLSRLSAAALRQGSLELARYHLARRPRVNPVRAYAESFEGHVEWLLAAELDVYHAYGFASVRQLGAGAELLASYCRWLDEGLAPAGEAFEAASRGAKALLLKLARIASGKRRRDLSGSFDAIAQSWDAGMGALAEHLGP